MDLKKKIEKGIKFGIISYDGDTVKFGRYVIGGISANDTKELVDKIERCCYRKDFGGKEFIEKIAL